MKSHLIKTISTITGIEPAILSHRTSLPSMSVAQRMSWASRRQTTREEDRAYSLLGIFNVSMPMLYGEGTRAFLRLQEEIIRSRTDHSIFAWEFEDGVTADGSLLASSPSNFANSQRIVQWGKPGAFEMTNRGLRIALPTLDYTSDYSESYGILNCRHSNDLRRTLALRLRKYAGGEEYHTTKGKQSSHPNFVTRLSERYDSRLVFIPEAHLESANKPAPLQITREFEPEAYKIKFWIPPLVHGSGHFKILKGIPESNWDLNDGVMYAGDTPRQRGSMRIETDAGREYNIAFGFDLVRTDYADKKDIVLPGVWAMVHTEGVAYPDPLWDLIDRSLACPHTLDSCRQGNCPNMHRTVTVYESPQTEKLEAQISQATMMGETVFIVTVRAQGC